MKNGVWMLSGSLGMRQQQSSACTCAARAIIGVERQYILGWLCLLLFLTASSDCQSYEGGCCRPWHAYLLIIFRRLFTTPVLLLLFFSALPWDLPASFSLSVRTRMHSRTHTISRKDEKETSAFWIVRPCSMVVQTVFLLRDLPPHHPPSPLAAIFLLPHNVPFWKGNLTSLPSFFCCLCVGVIIIGNEPSLFFLLLFIHSRFFKHQKWT